jgi:acetyl-CoA carboxylase biotin carboxyl carrier protein
MEIQDIKDLMDKMSASGISLLEIESEGFRLRLKRAAWTQTAAEAGAGGMTGAEQGGHAGCAASLAADKLEAAGLTSDSLPGLVVTSPTVGIFYSAPSPDNDPFVRVGSVVETGSPLCIIEAMKLMNEVDSPCDGIVLEILAENGQRVEYGQPLLRIGGN